MKVFHDEDFRMSTRSKILVPALTQESGGHLLYFHF